MGSLHAYRFALLERLDTRTGNRQCRAGIFATGEGFFAAAQAVDKVLEFGHVGVPQQVGVQVLGVGLDAADQVANQIRVIDAAHGQHAGTAKHLPSNIVAIHIDSAMVLGCNQPLGPLALADLIGLDTVLAILESLYDGFNDSKYRPAPLLKELVAAGDLGRKTGLGFHAYD